MSSATTHKGSTTSGLTRRALAGTGWSTVATVGKQLLTLASVTTVARLLGPDAYGLMGMAVIVTGFISNFRDLGTASAIVQRPVMTNKLLSSLFWVNVLVGTLFCSTVWAGAPIAARFFHSPEVSPVLRALSVSLLLASFGVVHSAVLTRKMTFKAIALTDLSAALAAYIAALTGALTGLGVWSLVLASLVNSLVSTLGYCFAAPFRPRLEFTWTEVKSVAAFSSNLSAFGVVNYAYRNADNVIVGRVLGSASLGFYQMAYNLMLTPLQSVSAVLAQVLMPAFAKIQDDDERFRSAFVRANCITALFTFPMSAGMGVVADPLVRAVLGPKWIGAIVPFQILATVGLVQSVSTLCGIIYQAKGRTDWMFRWSLVVLVTTVVGFLIGVKFGTSGVAAAYATVVLGLLTVPGFAIPFRLIGLKLSTFARALFPQLSATGLMVIACLLWQHALVLYGEQRPLVQLVSTVAIGAVAYLFCLMILRPVVLTYVGEIMSSSDHAIARISLAWLRHARLLPPETTPAPFL